MGLGKKEGGAGVEKAKLRVSHGMRLLVSKFLELLSPLILPRSAAFNLPAWCMLFISLSPDVHIILFSNLPVLLWMVRLLQLSKDESRQVADFCAPTTLFGTRNTGACRVVHAFDVEGIKLLHVNI